MLLVGEHFVVEALFPGVGKEFLSRTFVQPIGAGFGEGLSGRTWSMTTL